MAEGLRLLCALAVLACHHYAGASLTSSDIPLGLFFGAQSNLSRAVNESIYNLNSRISSDFSLLAYTKQTNISSSLKLKSDVCDVLGRGVYMTLASENSTTARSIMSITQTLQVPYITFSDQDLLDDEQDYKIRMTPSYIEVLAALEKFYKWQHIFYLYDDVAGLARFEKFYGIMNAPGTTPDQIEIDLRYLDPTLPNFYDQLRALDSKYAESHGKTFNEKVLVVDMTTQAMTQKVLDQLADVSMTRDNYHLIPATLAIANLNLDRLRNGGITVTGFQLNGLKDNLTETATLLAMDSIELIWRSLNNTVNRRTKFKDVYRRGEMFNGDIAGIPCHLYDKPWNKGNMLATSLKKTVFNGATGLVKLDKNGYRTGHSFNILQQVRNQNLNLVGSWSQRTGLVVVDEAIRPKKTVPVAETGFFNETFVITTVMSEPYAIDKKQPGLTGNDRFEGYGVDLAYKLAEIVGFNFTIVPVWDNDHGKLRPNGSWSGMIGELIAKRADMAIGDLTITSERERVVDFSTPFMNLGISIMIRKPEKQKPSVFSFMEPLSNMVWMCIAFSFTGVSGMIYVISRLSPNEWKVEEGPDGEETIENEFTAQNSAWFVAGALMCQGSELSPVAPSNRVVGSAWWLFSLIIISSYTANLAAFLTVENIVIPINNVQDLANHPTIKFGTLASGTTRVFFENSTMELYQNMWKKMSADPSLLVEGSAAGIDKVRGSKGKYAFLFESTTNEFANQRKPCNTLKVGENLDSKNYGIATPRGHKLRHQVTLAILRLHETGELNKLTQTWWYDKGQCSNEDGGSSIKALSLSNVAGVFYILIVGLLIAMLCALLEFVVKSVKDAKKFKKSLRASMRSKARLSIAGESDESPYIFLPRPSYKISVDPPSNK